MATKMVIDQPRPIVIAPSGEQWSSGICECDSICDCEFKSCFFKIFCQNFSHYLSDLNRRLKLLTTYLLFIDTSLNNKTGFLHSIWSELLWSFMQVMQNSQLHSELCTMCVSRLLRILVLPHLQLHHSQGPWRVFLPTSARVLGIHPTHYHGHESVYQTHLWHRGEDTSDILPSPFGLFYIILFGTEVRISYRTLLSLFIQSIINNHQLLLIID